MKNTLAVAFLIAQVAAFNSAAQTPPQIPIRQLAPVAAKTPITIMAIGGLQQLPDGRLLVNDIRGLRLLIFDSTLTKFTAVADTTATVGHYTGRAGSPLIPYMADSTLFVDVDSRSLVLIEPNGRMGRVMSPPTARDGVNMPGARADAKGRLVYRALPQMKLIPNPDGRGGMTPAPPPDSALIVRADFDTRKLDTLGSVRIVTPSRPVTTYDASGRRTMRQTVNPVPPAIDEWAMLSDGSVAIVRGGDYHVDWIYADGTRASTPKMPFDWRRLTDEDKKAKIDSAQKLLDSLTAIGKNTNRVFSFTVDGRGGPPTASETTTVKIDYVPLDEMGTYVAPIRTGSVKADADGNLWILPTTSLAAKGGLLYDVVNKKGELFERVQLPADRDIAGFGRGGVVYLSWREGTGGFYIERTKIVMPAGATIHPRPAP